MTQFLAMGGYAAFIWPAYGVTIFALGATIFLTLRAYAAAKARLAKLESR